MTIYDEMQEVAQELFAEFGQGVITYIALTPGTGPVDNPGPATETRYVYAGATARGVKFKYVSTGLAVASDTQVNCPVDPRFTPAQNGFIDIDGKRYKIARVIQKPDAGTPVAFTLICRIG